MLSSEKEYKEMFLILEKDIYKIKNALLTKQELVEGDLNSLYSHLKAMGTLLAEEKYLPRELTKLLFMFYNTAESEMYYRKSELEFQRAFIPYLQTYLDVIFGDE